MGSKFKAISTKLTSIPAFAISNSPSLSISPPGTADLSRIAHPTAIKKFANGPAPATQNMSRFGWCKLPKLTGTGFAHPKMNNGARVRTDNAIRKPGTAIVPIGSMCFSGFSVTRPSM